MGSKIPSIQQSIEDKNLQSNLADELNVGLNRRQFLRQRNRSPNSVALGFGNLGLRPMPPNFCAQGFGKGGLVV